MERPGTLIRFPTGQGYYIQGMPIGSSARKKYPELFDAIEKNLQGLEGLELEDAYVDQCYQIVKLQHPELAKDDFIIDITTAMKVKKIFEGLDTDSYKESLKKTS